ncbi:MAG: hypothetical protein MUC47_00665 [Candidatus Kapabacteria bacterium]|nr:hypothetical protein [Candidatus Kapabacteria bacterium]
MALKQAKGPGVNTPDATVTDTCQKKLANRRTQFGTTVLVHLQERVLAQYKQSVADVIEPRVERHTHTSMTNGILDAM